MRNFIFGTVANLESLFFILTLIILVLTLTSSSVKRWKLRFFLQVNIDKLILILNSEILDYLGRREIVDLYISSASETRPDLGIIIIRKTWPECISFWKLIRGSCIGYAPAVQLHQIVPLSR